MGTLNLLMHFGSQPPLFSIHPLSVFQSFLCRCNSNSVHPSKYLIIVIKAIGLQARYETKAKLCLQHRPMRRLWHLRVLRLILHFCYVSQWIMKSIHSSFIITPWRFISTRTILLCGSVFRQRNKFFLYPGICQERPRKKFYQSISLTIFFASTKLCRRHR
jgi:hypothetical protein